MTLLPFSFPSAVWGIASALAIVAIGTVCLAGGRARPRGALAFGLFAMTWGAQVVLGNAQSFIRDPGALATTHLFFLALHLPLPYFLMEFVTSQEPRGTPAWRILRGGAAAVGLTGALVLVLAPELLFQGVATGQFSIYPRAGPLFVPLVIIPQYVAFGLALLALHLSRVRAATPRIGRRVATLLVGLGLYVGFAAGNNASFFAVASYLYPAPTHVPYTIVFGALSLLVGGLGILAIRRIRLLPQEDRRTERLVAAALLVPLAYGALEGVLSVTALFGFESVGLWRLSGVAVIAYGIARWRVFDLPQRAARTAADAAGASGALAGGAAVYGFSALLTTAPAVPALAGLLMVAGTFIPGIRLARRLFGTSPRPGMLPGAEDHLYGQRIDAYRAALEASYARGTLDEDAGFLEALRQRFGITESEDRLLRYYAMSSVLVPRDGDVTTTYERLRLLGEGGAGRTWLARDRVRDRLVVLKEPLPHWQHDTAVKEAVLREARTAARVRHPNVVAIEAIVEHKGLPVIVMEYLEGGSLEALLRGRGVLPWQEAAAVLLPILRGVEAIHASGIVHRDLKPSNILLDSDGTPKIADFGIAVTASSATRTIVEAAPFAGTLSYAAPEVRAGSPPDHRADVYGCGAILHECLYGSPPGPGAPVVAANSVPEAVARALARALAVDPAQRHSTARAFHDELARVLER